jgi:hypothetical protein
MKNSWLYIKTPSSTTELRNLPKSEFKMTPTNRAIDTKVLFKSDQLKDLSKLALNSQSRDVSYIRDKHTIQLPKIIPNLPTDFEHLKHLYYSSDSFGMPVSISSQNFHSSLTCKKHSCVEKVLSTHSNVSSPEDFNLESIDRVNLGNPAGRQDIKLIQNWLGYMKETFLDNLKTDNDVWNPDIIEKAEIVYVMAGKEVIRQVSVQCIERGEVLKEILWFFTMVYKYQKSVFSKEYKERLEKIEKEMEDKVYKHARHIAQYEIRIKKKHDKLTNLKKAYKDLESLLKTTQDNLSALKSSNKTVKGVIFNNKQISPTIHKSNLKKTSIKITIDPSSNESIYDTDKNIEEDKTQENLKDLESDEKLENSEKNEIFDEEIEKTEDLETGNENNEDFIEDNEKIIQTDILEYKFIDQSIQTDPIATSRGQKHHFEFRSKVQSDLKQKKAVLSIEVPTSISLAPIPSLSTLQFNPNPVEFLEAHKKNRSESVLVTNSQLLLPMSLNPAETQSKIIKDNINILKRNSMIISPILTKDLLVPTPIPTDPKAQNPGKMSQDLSNSIETDKNDIILMHILAKKKVYEDLSNILKEKKNEVQTISLEIEEKKNELNSVAKEVQMKYLELQAIEKPSKNSLNFFKRVLVQNIEGIKEEKSFDSFEKKVLVDVNGVSVEIDARLSELIPSSVDIVSWKTGFSAGYEKGMSVGLVQGEELGKEVGEEQGFVKGISNSKKNTLKDLMSDASSDDSDDGPKRNIKTPKNLEVSVENKRSAMHYIGENRELARGKSLDCFLRVYDQDNLPDLLNKSHLVDKKSLHNKISSFVDDSYKNIRLDSDKIDDFAKSTLEEQKKIDDNPGKYEEYNSGDEVFHIQITQDDQKNPENQNFSLNPEEKDLNTMISTPKPIKKNQKANTIKTNFKSSDEIDKNQSEPLLLNQIEPENQEIDRGALYKKKDQDPHIRKRTKEITKFNEFNFHSQRNHIIQKKTHKAPKIISKFLGKNIETIIKVSKMSKRMAFRLINSIYQSYISKIKQKEPLQTLINHSYEDLLSKYSLKAVSEKKLVELISSLYKYSDCKRSQMFLRLSGISEKINIPGYSQYSLYFYINALNFLLNSKLGIVIGLDDTADKIMIPLVRALECSKELFEGKIDKNNLSKLLNKLETCAIKDPKRINHAGLIENELALEILLETYENYQKSILEGVSLMINSIKYKENYNQIYKPELGIMIKNICPSKYKEDDINDNETLNTEEFTLICLDRNLLSIDDIKSFVMKEKNNVPKDILAQKAVLENTVAKLDKKFKGLEPGLWSEKVKNLFSDYLARDPLESFISYRIYSNELLLN